MKYLVIAEFEVELDDDYRIEDFTREVKEELVRLEVSEITVKARRPDECDYFMEKTRLTTPLWPDGDCEGTGWYMCRECARKG